MYEILLDVYEAFENLKLKDQRVSQTDMKEIRRKGKSFVKECCALKFKPLQGLKPKDQKELLKKLRDSELNFSQFKEAADNIKKMAKVKNILVTSTGSASWEDCLARYEIID